MAARPKDRYEQEFDGKFLWRRERQIANLRELADITNARHVDGIDRLPNLSRGFAADDPKAALSMSIVYLWGEAVECFILGEFQACILACGAVVERCLKLAYQDAGKKLPRDAKWGLGLCIRKCRDLVKPDVLTYARRLTEPRNSRTHALLEHTNPTWAYLGGKSRRVILLPSGHAEIEPYRGDAREVIELTWKILLELFGDDKETSSRSGS